MPNLRGLFLVLTCCELWLLGAAPLVWGRAVSTPPSAPSVSVAEAAATSVPPPLAHTVLPNGMRIVLVENDTMPLAHVSVVYQLPTAAPSIRSAWLSQLLRELLPSLGTTHLPPSARRRLLLAADTSVERLRATIDSGDLVLSVSIPPEALELMLFIEADRMGFAADSLTQDSIDEAQARLRNSVLAGDELADVGLDDSVTRTRGTFPGELQREVSELVRAAELKHYMQRYLQAGNATLVIQGPLHTQPTLEAVWRTFGRLAGGQRLERRTPQGVQGSPIGVALDRLSSGVATKRFALSWRVTACSSPEQCPLGVFAELFEQRLRPMSRYCTRVWVAQSSRVGRFTVSCKPSNTFDAEQWTSHVSTQLGQLGQSTPTPDELRSATSRYWVREASLLELPEHTAALLARQLARGQVPSVSHRAAVVVPSAPAIREVLRSEFSDHSDESGQARGHESPSFTLQPALAEVRTPDDPTWYRPPRKGPTRAIQPPQVLEQRLSPALVLRHLENPNALVTRVSLRGMLRDRGVDPPVALVALGQLLRVQSGQPSLADRLWIDHGVLTAWDITPNTFSLKFTGVPDGMESAMRSVRDALQRGCDTGSFQQAKDAALARLSAMDYRSLLEELQFRVGSPFVTRVASGRLVNTQTRINRLEPKRVAELCGRHTTMSEFDISILGPQSSDLAQRIAAAALSSTWARSAPNPYASPRGSRTWIFDADESKQANFEVIWPSGGTAAELRAALAVCGVSQAAKALGNLNAARPHNPTTQFTLHHQSLAEGDIEIVSVRGVELGRLEAVLRELDGYFARLMERVDFAQLARLGIHQLQREYWASFAVPVRTLRLLEERSASHARQPIDSVDQLGPVSRDRLLEWTRKLTLQRGTIIAEGPAREIEPVLRLVHGGESVVITR